jgi:integrase
MNSWPQRKWRLASLQGLNLALLIYTGTKALSGGLRQSRKTRKNYLALLKTMLNYAVKWGVIDRNPIAQVRPPKIVKKFHFFSKADVAKLIGETQGPLRTAIVLLVNTGRRAELFNLSLLDAELQGKGGRVWSSD